MRDLQRRSALGPLSRFTADKATVARAEGREAIFDALELAAHLAVEERFAALAADCAGKARAGDFEVGLLIALRKAINAAQPVVLAYGVADDDFALRSIMENVLGALATPRLCHFAGSIRRE